MKKKVFSLLLTSALVLSLTACSSTASTTAAQAGETYTGTVSAISEDSMTLTTEDSGDVLITLSSDTTFSYEMGDFSGDGSIPGGDGEAPSGDGEAPSGDGEAPSGDGEAPSGSGEAPSGDGEAPSDDDSQEDSTDTGSSDGESTSQKMPDSVSLPDNDSAFTSVSSSDSSDSSSDSDSSDESSGSDSSDGSVPSDLPDGEAPSGDGEAPSGDGEMPSGGGEMGEAVTLTYEDVSEGDTVTVVIDDDGIAESVTIAMETGSDDADDSSASNSGITYTAVYEYTEDTEVSGETLESTGTDEETVLVAAEGITASLDSVTITRDSDDSTGGDDSSFYGVGASALVTAGTLSISDSEITSDAAGGAGVFAYGDGVAYVSDTSITTSGDTSGGIHAAGGGTLYAWDLTVETSGESSAAIRSDRGSGTIVADGGTYTSNGTGSPAVYSTADITVNEAVLTSNASEAICIEGLNTIRLFDCDLTGNMSDSDENDCTWNVILYQSQSGDSEEGNSTFEMVGGTLTAGNGGMFYTTNTESTFVISDVDITCADDSEFLLKCTGNSNERGWGTAGANGADCSFTAIAQELSGDVIWDTISELDFYLTDSSSLTGAVLNDESQAGDGGDGYADVYIDETSTWIVTGDSALSALYCAGTIEDEEGNAVTIVGTDGTTYVSGTSEYTITVDSYSDSADTSGAAALDTWSDYAVDRL